MSCTKARPARLQCGLVALLGFTQLSADGNDPAY